MELLICLAIAALAVGGAVLLVLLSANKGVEPPPPVRPGWTEQGRRDARREWRNAGGQYGGGGLGHRETNERVSATSPRATHEARQRQIPGTAPLGSDFQEPELPINTVTNGGAPNQSSGPDRGEPASPSVNLFDLEAACRRLLDVIDDAGQMTFEEARALLRAEDSRAVVRPIAGPTAAWRLLLVAVGDDAVVVPILRRTMGDVENLDRYFDTGNYNGFDPLRAADLVALPRVSPDGSILSKGRIHVR